MNSVSTTKFSHTWWIKNVLATNLAMRIILWPTLVKILALKKSLILSSLKFNVKALKKNRNQNKNMFLIPDSALLTGSPNLITDIKKILFWKKKMIHFQTRNMVNIPRRSYKVLMTSPMSSLTNPVKTNLTILLRISTSNSKMSTVFQILVIEIQFNKRNPSWTNFKVSKSTYSEILTLSLKLNHKITRKAAFWTFMTSLPKTKRTTLTNYFIVSNLIRLSYPHPVPLWWTSNNKLHLISNLNRPKINSRTKTRINKAISTNKCKNKQVRTKKLRSMICFD